MRVRVPPSAPKIASAEVTIRLSVFLCADLEAIVERNRFSDLFVKGFLQVNIASLKGIDKN